MDHMTEISETDTDAEIALRAAAALLKRTQEAASIMERARSSPHFGRLPGSITSGFNDLDDSLSKVRDKAEQSRRSA